MRRRSVLATAAVALALAIVSAPPASSQSPPTFYQYRSPSTTYPHAARDLEFWWSATYDSTFNRKLVPPGGGQNDLDRLGYTLTEEWANPFGFPMTDIQLVYDYLAFPDATRNGTYQSNVELYPDAGFMVSLPQGESYPARDRGHVDTYIYAPRFSHSPTDDFYEPNPIYPAGCYDSNRPPHAYYYPCKNYGVTNSSFTSAFEDTSSGHAPGEVLYRNSLSMPGPVPSAVGDTSATRWTRQNAMHPGIWIHEFQHVFNNKFPSGVLTEIWSSAAQALAGEFATTPIRFDAPYTWSLQDAGNYQAWRSFTAYLAYNLRGTDTTYAGRADDLLWRWAHSGTPTFSGLVAQLSDANCAECISKPYLAGLSGTDRLSRIIHNWRVANYVNNSALADKQYGYPAHMGFVPSRDVGLWQDKDQTPNNAVAIPPEILGGTGLITRDSTYAGVRRSPTPGDTTTTPVSLSAWGSDYYIVKADAALRSANRTLVFTFTPLARVSQNWSCGFNGRVLLTLVSFQVPADSVATLNNLWRHPEWVSSVAAPVALDVDSVRSEASVTLSTFGSTHQAAMLVISLVDGVGGFLASNAAASTSRVLPYALNVGIRTSPFLATNPVAIRASADTVDRNPAWSPSGTELAYVHQVSSTSQLLYRQNVSGGSPTPVFVPASPIRIYMCDWSPRGDKIVYDRSPNLSSPFDVWTYDVTTGAHQQITTSADLDVYPAFSPDGQRIAYWRYAGSTTWQIRTVAVDGSGDALVIAPGAGATAAPRWSPDGQWIYFINSTTGQVHRVPASGGSSTAQPAFGTPGAFDLHIGGGRPVITRSEKESACSNSSPTRQVIELRNLATQAGDPRFVRTLTTPTFPRYSFDGTRVAYGWSTGSPLNDQDVYFGGITFNHPPTFSAGSYADATIPTCDHYIRDLSATDPDGETVTFEAVGLPPGALFQSGYRFRWTPSVDQIGDWYVVFRAKDGSGGVHNKVVKITVEDLGLCDDCPPNHPDCLPARNRPVQPALPTEFALGPGQPNPFEGSTNFEFALPKAAAVKIEVFDLVGRRVRVLLDGTHAAGFHTVTWDGANGRGERVPPGIYVCRLTAGDFRAQRKLRRTR